MWLLENVTLHVTPVVVYFDSTAPESQGEELP